MFQRPCPPLRVNTHPSTENSPLFAETQVEQGSGYGSASGAGASSGGGHVGITQASTFAGENGNTLPTNDVHLDNPQSSFVIGPDGKVPSLASQVPPQPLTP